MLMYKCFLCSELKSQPKVPKYFSRDAEMGNLILQVKFT